MSKDTKCLTGPEMEDTPAELELKLGQQRFVGNTDPAILLNNKKAVESTPGAGNVNIPLWYDALMHQTLSAETSDHLSGHEQPSRAFNLFGKNLFSASNGNLNLEREGAHQRVSVSSIISFVSQSIDNSGVGGCKSNQVTNNQHHYSNRENDPIATTTTYHRGDSSISLGPTYIHGDGNPMEVSLNFGQMGLIFIPKNQAFNKGDGTFMLMGNHWGWGDDSMLTMGQSIAKGNCYLALNDQEYKNYTGNSMLMCPAYQRHQSFTDIGPYDRRSANFVSADDDAIFNSLDTNHGNENANIVSMATASNRTQSMGQTCNNVMVPAFPFVAVHKETGSSLVDGCDLLTSQTSIGASKEPEERDPMEYNNQIGSIDPAGVTKWNGVAKKNSIKRLSRKGGLKSNFPPNVKSLLSTGVFNGVPVMYFSWSREKKLAAVIKGPGYLCTCANCDLTKLLNAYEFERHAGCSTKHPNKNIYFENGMSIYEVVQVLQETSQEELFETIENVTGSPIHDINFNVWKASYQAATHEMMGGVDVAP